MIGLTIAIVIQVIVTSFYRIRNAIVIAVQICVIRTTVTVKIGLWQGGRCSGIVQAVAIIISKVVNSAVGVFIDTTGFDQIVQTVVVAVEIKVIGCAVFVLIRLWQCSNASRIIETITVYISKVIDHTIAIGVIATSFTGISDAIVVTIQVVMISDAVIVSVYLWKRAFCGCIV